MKLSVFNIKKFLIFSQKNFFIYILGNGNPKNLLYSMRQNFLIFQEVTFWGRKSKTPTLKNVLIYQEIELSSLKFKTHFILQEKVAKSEKIKFIILLKKKKKKKSSEYKTLAKIEVPLKKNSPGQKKRCPRLDYKSTACYNDS